MQSKVIIDASSSVEDIIALAGRSRGHKGFKAPPVSVVSRDGLLVPSFSQQRLWFLAQIEGGSEAYHITLNVRLKGDLDESALRNALDGLVARHETLRTSFYTVDGELYQRIAEEDVGFCLRADDFSGDGDLEARLLAEAERESSSSFDLANETLIRGRLLRLGERDHALLITMHHIASDGWSMGILARELSELYRAYVLGIPEALNPLPVQYADYAAWQRQWLSGSVLAEQADYWRQTLSDVPSVIELPTDRRRPARQDYTGNVIPVRLDEGISAELVALSKRHGVTLFMTVLAAWALVLSRLSSQEDVVIGVPSANRNRLEIEGLIGFFVNTLALRVDLSGTPSLLDLLTRVKKVALDAQAHQDIPFEQVVDIVNPVRSLSHTPLFQVMFAWQNNEVGVLDLPGLEVDRISRLSPPALFDLLLNLREESGCIAGGLYYATSLFDQDTAERYAWYLKKVLSEMARDSSQCAAAVPILSSTEEHQLLVEWNATEAEYPKALCVHQLFEEQVVQNGAATAVVYGDCSLTYEQLNSEANRLAHHLRSLGIKPESKVVICVGRSLEMIVGLLAILKAGGAYVPLDATYPNNRLIHMIEDCSPSVILTNGETHDKLRSALELSRHQVPVLNLSADRDWSGGSIANLAPATLGLTSKNLCYVIYTSGSTGTPKGVMIEHHSVLRLLFNNGYVNFGIKGRIGFHSNLAFDASTVEIWSALLFGSKLVIFSREDVLYPDKFQSILDRESLTFLFITSALFKQHVLAGRVDFSSVENLLSGGEVADPKAFEASLSKGAPKVFNVYGPTETTTFAAIYRIEALPSAIPIGRPIGNTRIYLLDRLRNPVPRGAVGEIYIGGAGVARGYLNQAELTADRFLDSPFVLGDRLYKTGDLGRYLRDGNIEFLGRNDFQVKIRGFRIELGEIEAKLGRYPGVLEAVVLALEAKSGDKQLVAYYTTRQRAEAIPPQDLRDYLSTILPEYMVPTAYVHLDELPLTTNGKLNRKALPSPEESAYQRREYEAPVGAVEEAIAAVWSDVLKISNISRHDNFFDLGGHSLMAIRVLERIKHLGFEGDIHLLFTSPILSDLAAVLRRTDIKAPPVSVVSRDGLLVPSFSQQRLWFLAQIEGGSEAYHITLNVRLKGDLDESALRNALDGLVARHETLRTSFYTVDGELYQRIAEEDVGFCLRADDFSGDGDLEARLLAEAERESSSSFDLANETLIRGRLLRLGERDHALLITMHHIASDGWSMGILARELSELYRAYVLGIPEALNPLPVQYADYAAWQRQWLSGSVLAEQADYWRQTLSDVPSVIELPTDRRRPARQDYTGNVIPVRLDEGISAELVALSKRHGVTLFMTVLAAWALVLSRLSSQEDVVIGVPSANRNRLEIEGLIGFFVNTLALRVDLSGTPSLLDLLTRVKKVALDAQAHQDIPFEQVVDIVNPVRSLSHTPLFQVMFAWQNNEVGVLDLPGLEVDRISRLSPPALFDLLLNLREESGCIAGGLYYATSLFDQDTAERYAWYLKKVLSEMARDSSQCAAAVPILSSTEEHQLLVEWNATEAEYPKALCVHQLFEEQVVQNGAATAVVYGDCSLTYEQLNSEANRLAHHLRSLGIKPESKVVICVGRSLEMIVGLLAILKAGGAYVPLDATYPNNRLIHMIEDCSPSVILTNGETHDKLRSALELSRHQVPVLNLSADRDWSGGSIANLAPATLGLTSKNLCYVIYTSGSTGTPKGVMMSHGALVNLLVWQTGEVSGVCTLQFTSISFDVSFQETFSALISGGLLVLIPDSVRYNLAGNLSLLKNHKVQAIFAPQIVLDHLANGLTDRQSLPLKHIFQAGEALKLTPGIANLARDLGASLYNHYGPTETHVVTSFKVDIANALLFPPIGRPIGNTRIYLLDRLRNPVPRGAVGEIYIGGAGVARGYLNQAELTADRFLDSPFVLGDRLYKTGDLGRYLRDGNIEFLGRNDFQVKIRGFRIELGEIEAKLGRYPGVLEAVVLALEAKSGDKQLVAYYTTRQRAEAIPPQDLRDYLSTILPEYMVPTAYVHLDELPLTTNGKLNRKALPSPEESAYQRREYEAPVGAVEEAIAAVWSDVLKISNISRHDNFFDLGGHSLMAIRVLERIKHLGFEGDIHLLFTSPILSDLAAVLRRTDIKAPPVSVVSRDGLLVPSFSQQRLWFLAQIEGGSEAYHITLNVRLKGDLDESALRNALDGLVARHETLRTSFYTVDGELYQRIAEEDVGFCLRADDFSGDGDLEARLLAEAERESSSSFDLANETLIRGRLLRLGERDHALLITMHHIASDGWSMGILARELSELYRAYVLGIPEALNPLPVQYADYAAWQRQWLSGSVLAEQADYWRQTLSDVPSVIELPTDRRRPARQDYTGNVIPVRLDEGISAELVALSKRHGVTLFMTVLAAWALVLSRLSSQEDVVIGVPSANRNRLEIEGLIGFFVNTLALRVDLSGTPSLLDLLTRVKKVALDAQAHQDIPFEQVVDIVNPVRSLSHTPLFQVMFAWQNNEVGVLDLPGLEVDRISRLSPPALFDLLLNLREESGCIAGGLYYATSLFDQDTAERYAWYLKKVLSEMARDSSQCAAAVPILSSTEEHQLLVEWNATEAEYPKALCVHQLFEEQVVQNGAATAVVYGDCSLTYEQLNSEANRLAHHLRSLGIKPESKVVICVGRSLEMIVGLLAILKAGGAYVPLDATYPNNRLIHMIEDCSPSVILTNGETHDKLRSALELSRHQVPVLNLSADRDWSGGSIANLAPATLGLTSKNLCYVIYTSGSTGTPKGVMMSHGALVNLLVWQTGEVSGVCTLQFTSISFDVSFQETFSALISGGLLVLIPDSVRYNLAGNLSLLKNHKVQAIFAPQIVLDHLANGLTDRQSLPLKHIFQAGEALKLTPGIANLARDLGASLYNHYGPTETHVVTSFKVDIANALLFPPIGRPIGNTRIYLLDRLRNPVPRGAVGEIYIGGAGVARGYLNQAELTADRFLDSPFVLGDRLYKTGDLGRYLRDGNIEFLGRNDFQVKIRGFRIELGEIEAKLGRYPGVLEAVVLALEAKSGDKQLVAYYTTRQRAEAIPPQDLRDYLSTILPEYMVPTAYVHLDELPLTTNGKLNRKALPSPEESAYQRREYEAPVGAVEEAIAAVWSDVLKISNISRHDNFFDLGGHSLMAIRVLERIKHQLDVRLDISILFKEVTVMDLGSYLEKTSSSDVITGYI